MNENPGETPNPLNPTPQVGPNPEPDTGMLDANPSEPIPDPVEQPKPVEPMAPVGQPQPVESADSASGTEGPAATGTAPVETVAETFTETVTVESLNPEGRPMEKVVPAEPPKKKKKVGLIVGIIILVMALIGGGIAAAIVVMNMNKTDAVAVAMGKLMSGKLPANVAIDGSIDLLVNDKSLPVTRVNINLNSDIVTGSAINTSSAVLTVTTKDNQDYSVEFEEVYAENGDLYFKIDGATKLFEGMELSTAAVPENCVYSDSGATNCVEVTGGLTEGGEAAAVEGEVIAGQGSMTSSFTPLLLGIAESIDGKYLRISTDELSEYSGGTLADTPISCMTNLVSDLNKNSNSTAQLYSKYPFVGSTTEGVLVTSKGNPVYRVMLDGKNLASFVNSIQNPALTDDLYACLNWDGNTSIDAAELTKLIEGLPPFYVEVNGNDEFTRIYLESELNDGGIHMVIDLGLSYPRNVNVSEPVEYTDFSETIQQIMTSLFNMPSVEVEETVVVTE